MAVEQIERDRRRGGRVAAGGRVVLQDGYGRGTILDVSTTCVRFRLEGPCAAHKVDHRLDLELRFDGARGRWWVVSGHIVRVDPRGELVVAFESAPAELEAWLTDELVGARAR